MLLESLKNRPVTVWGNGVEGRAATVFLEKRNCTVNVVEDPVSIPFSGIIVKSPGISLYRHEIKWQNSTGPFLLPVLICLWRLPFCSLNTGLCWSA